MNLWEHSYWEEHDGQADSTYLDNFWKNIDWLKVSNNFELYNLKGEVANILWYLFNTLYLNYDNIIFL